MDALRAARAHFVEGGEQPIHGPHATDIGPLVEEGGVDLRGRAVDESRITQVRQHLRLRGRGQRAGRPCGPPPRSWGRWRAPRRSRASPPADGTSDRHSTAAGSGATPHVGRCACSVAVTCLRQARWSASPPAAPTVFSGCRSPDLRASAAHAGARCRAAGGRARRGAARGFGPRDCVNACRAPAWHRLRHVVRCYEYSLPGAVSRRSRTARRTSPLPPRCASCTRR